MVVRFDHMIAAISWFRYEITSGYELSTRTSLRRPWADRVVHDAIHEELRKPHMKVAISSRVPSLPPFWR